MRRYQVRHFRDVRRPIGANLLAGRQGSQVPVICEADIIDTTEGTCATTDPSRVNCGRCRARLEGRL